MCKQRKVEYQFTIYLKTVWMPNMYKGENQFEFFFIKFCSSYIALDCAKRCMCKKVYLQTYIFIEIAWIFIVLVQKKISLAECFGLMIKKERSRIRILTGSSLVDTKNIFHTFCLQSFSGKKVLRKERLSTATS